MAFTAPEGTARPIVVTGDGMTKQSHRDECDINKLVSRAKRGDITAFMMNREAEYMDTPDISYQEALNLVNEANTMFGEMPSKLRKRFENNPQVFMDFVHDEKNLEEMYEMGLANRPAPEPEPIPAPETLEPSE